jgi:stalled ribosome rescue protein Dom34
MAGPMPVKGTAETDEHPDKMGNKDTTRIELGRMIVISHPRFEDFRFRRLERARPKLARSV